MAGVYLILFCDEYEAVQRKAGRTLAVAIEELEFTVL